MTVGSSPQPGWGPLSPVAFPFNLHSIFSSVNIKLLQKGEECFFSLTSPYICAALLGLSHLSYCCFLGEAFGNRLKETKINQNSTCSYRLTLCCTKCWERLFMSITHHRKPSPKTEHPHVKSKPHSWPRSSEEGIFHPCAKAPSVVCPVSTAGDLMDA